MAEPVEVKASENVTVESQEVTVQSPEELMEKLNKLGVELRAVVIAAKRLPRTKGLDPHQDPTRSIALSQAHMQTGFMWMRRAINPTLDF
jgi:hypothetical protein